MIFISASPASAHVLKSDGSIGAILHVTPDDDPIAGGKTDLFFDFKDKQGKFTAQNCDCTVAILRGQDQIFSQSLFVSNADPNSKIAVISFTFPERDVYKIKVFGNPRTPDAFQPFNLEYDLRVAKGVAPVSENIQEHTKVSSDLRPVYYTIGGLLVFLAIVFIIKKVKSKHLLIFLPLTLFVFVHATPAVSSFIHNEHHHLSYSQHHPCCLPPAVDNADYETLAVVPKQLPEDSGPGVLIRLSTFIDNLQNKSPPYSFS